MLSRTEEALAALHIIVAALLFDHGWDMLAWVFVARAVIDETAAITFAAHAVVKRRHRAAAAQ
jgi:hypothetical protein